jgi:hypothetical protein
VQQEMFRQAFRVSGPATLECRNPQPAAATPESIDLHLLRRQRHFSLCEWKSRCSHAVAVRIADAYTILSVLKPMHDSLPA